MWRINLRLEKQDFLTWVVAEVGKTKMCVQETSSGVDSWQLTDAWLNLSSGVNWSGIKRRAESGSRETRHALRIDGTSVGYCKLHWLHISFKCLEASSKDFRLSSQLHPDRVERCKLEEEVKNRRFTMNLCLHCDKPRGQQKRKQCYIRVQTFQQS